MSADVCYPFGPSINKSRVMAKNRDFSGTGQLFKRALLGSVSSAAFIAGLLVGNNDLLAQDATTEVNNAQTITASQATGLLESNETGTVNVTIDPAAATTMGGAANDAVTITESSNATNLVLNLADSSGSDPVTFAGAINLKGHADDTLTININTVGTVTFNRSMLVTTGKGIALNVATGRTLNFDASAGAFSVAATIDATTQDGGTLNVVDSDTNWSEGITFTGAVGGTNRLGTINVGSNTLGGQGEFNNNVTAQNITVRSGDAPDEIGDIFFRKNVTVSNAITLNRTSGWLNSTFDSASGDMVVDAKMVFSGTTAGTGANLRRTNVILQGGNTIIFKKS